MEITYRNNFGDILWYNFYQITHVRSYQIVGSVVFLLFTLNYFTRGDNKVSLSSQVLAFIIMLIPMFLLFIGLMCILAGLTYFVIPNQQTRLARKQNVKLSVVNNGIVLERESVRREFGWLEIKKILETRNYILMMVSERQGYIIPKRAFANKVDAEKFFNYAYKLFTKTRNVSMAK